MDSIKQLHAEFGEPKYLQTTDEYTKQAQDFLKATETEMTSKYLGHGIHFDNDKMVGFMGNSEYKNGRALFEITIKRGTRSYTFKFGQSLHDSYKRIKSRIVPDILGVKVKHPSAYTVLASVQKDFPGSFEDFCCDFGYDADSRTAEKTWQAVINEYAGLAKLFTDAELEKMAEIQ